MGLVKLGSHRIGFWMADRTRAPDLPPGLVPREEGSPVPGGATLVVVGAGEAGEPEWAVLLHAGEGASLLLPWGERLFVAVGPAAVLLGEDGAVHARRQFDDELLSAWPIEQGLLLFGRRGARLVDRAAADLWSRPLVAEGFHLLDAGKDRLRVAALQAGGWDEIVLDAATGAIVG